MPDIYAANVVLHFNYNTDASRWDYIPLDCSQANNTVFSSGLTRCTTDQTKYGDQSGFYNVGFQYIAHNSNLDLTGVDWTIETWMRPTGNYSYYNVIAAKRDSGAEWQIGLNITTGRMYYYNGTVYSPSSGAVPTANVWSHLAWVRSGTSMTFYINGVNVYTTTIATAVNAGTNRVTVGTWSNEYYYGYLDDFRITKGVARYTADFSESLPDAIEYSVVEPTDVVRDYGQTLNGNIGAEAYANNPIAIDYGQTLNGNIGAEAYNSAPSATDTGQPFISYYWSGDGRIYGTVKQKSTPANLPLKRRIAVYDRSTNTVVAETWSDPVTGEYSFDYLSTSRNFFVVAFDHTGTYRAVAADAIYPTEIT